MSAILNICGEDHALQFVKKQYWNGNLAIQVLSENEENGEWDLWCLLTVNLAGFLHDENEAFLDTNNCSREIINWIFENKYAEKIGERQSGFCTYPLVEFSKAFMELIVVTEKDLVDEEE